MTTAPAKWWIDHEATVRAMVADGATMSEIARGMGVSKSTISGKLSREGIRLKRSKHASGHDRRAQKPVAESHPWKRQRTPNPALTATAAAASASPAQRHRHRSASANAMSPLPALMQGMVCVVGDMITGPPSGDPQSGKSLMELEPADCRWIIGDPRAEHFFCAQPRLKGSAYCPHHTKRSVQASWWQGKT